VPRTYFERPNRHLAPGASAGSSAPQLNTFVIA
jgi:hypothetical protein